jgi:hypothetical protein
MLPSGASGGNSSVVKIAPRNTQLPRSRPRRLVCLPCQPIPAACASGFSITGAVSTNTLISPPAPLDQPAPQPLQPRLDRVMVIPPLRIDADRPRSALQHRQRVMLRRITLGQHHHRPRLGPQRRRIAAPRHPLGHPRHLPVPPGIQTKAAAAPPPPARHPAGRPPSWRTPAASAKRAQPSFSLTSFLVPKYPRGERGAGGQSPPARPSLRNPGRHNAAAAGSPAPDRPAATGTPGAT